VDLGWPPDCLGNFPIFFGLICASIAFLVMLLTDFRYELRHVSLRAKRTRSSSPGNRREVDSIILIKLPFLRNIFIARFSSQMYGVGEILFSVCWLYRIEGKKRIIMTPSLVFS